MADDAAKFLLGAGQKSGNIFKSDKRNVEGIAKSNEARAFDGGVDVEASGEKCRLIGDHSDASSAQPGETHHDVFGKVFVDFEEVAIVHDAMQDVFDVVGAIRLGGDDGVERIVAAVDGIGRLDLRRILAIVLGHEREQLADQGDAIGIVPSEKMG